MVYKVALHRWDERYSVSVPGLPGCCSQAVTEAEALEKIADAITASISMSTAEVLLYEAELREVEVAE